jgi:hypothetical protein
MVLPDQAEIERSDDQNADELRRHWRRMSFIETIFTGWWCLFGYLLIRAGVGIMRKHVSKTTQIYFDAAIDCATTDSSIAGEGVEEANAIRFRRRI